MLPPLPENITELSPEQQFKIAAAKIQLAEASPDQMQELIIGLLTQKFAHDNLINFLVKSSFGGCEI